MHSWHVVDHWSSLNFHDMAAQLDAQSPHLTRRSFPALLTSHDMSRGLAGYSADRRLLQPPECGVRIGSCVTGRQPAAIDRPSTWTRPAARPGPAGVTPFPTLDDRTRIGRSRALYFLRTGSSPCNQCSDIVVPVNSVVTTRECAW